MRTRRPRSLVRTLAAAYAAFALLAALPTPSRAQTAPPVAAPGVADAKLQEFASAWSHINAYSATITVFERKGEQLQNLVFDYTFRKPSGVTLQARSGPNSGATLHWDGGSTVVGQRKSGLIGWFKKTFSLHDPVVTTIRGASVDELSFGAILAHAEQARGAISESSGEEIDGTATDAVSLIPAVPDPSAALSREVVEISKATHVPARILGYEGTLLVREVKFSNVKIEE
jgi:outer membrane lipoprotein-sorting protein